LRTETGLGFSRFYFGKLSHAPLFFSLFFSFKKKIDFFYT
jgi:hypothetical protein